MGRVYVYFRWAGPLLHGWVDFLGMGYDSSSLHVSYKTDKLTEYGLYYHRHDSFLFEFWTLTFTTCVKNSLCNSPDRLNWLDNAIWPLLTLEWPLIYVWIISVLSLGQWFYLIWILDLYWWYRCLKLGLVVQFSSRKNITYWPLMTHIAISFISASPVNKCCLTFHNDSAYRRAHPGGRI